METETLDFFVNSICKSITLKQYFLSYGLFINLFTLH